MEKPSSSGERRRDEGVSDEEIAEPDAEWSGDDLDLVSGVFFRSHRVMATGSNALQRMCLTERRVLGPQGQDCLIEDLTQEMVKTSVRDPEPVSTSDSLRLEHDCWLRFL